MAKPGFRIEISPKPGEHSFGRLAGLNCNQKSLLKQYLLVALPIATFGNMKISNEHEEFSRRLVVALKAAGERVDSPTGLARGFNRRHAGHPVSVHSARKWLYGEAIPTQEKLRVLAGWLGRTSEWLRFGGDAPNQSQPIKSDFDFELMRSIATLSATHQEVVRDLVNSLRRAEKGSR